MGKDTLYENTDSPNGRLFVTENPEYINSWINKV